MQHHHRTQNWSIGLAYRGQAVRQQACFTFNVDAQVFGQAFQTAPAQHCEQLLIQLRPAQCFAQSLAQSPLVPT